MTFNSNPLKQKLQALVIQWQDCGLPGRQTLMEFAKDIEKWKQAHNIKGLWPNSPVFVTASIDDAWGHGLELIETYATILGMTVIPLGLEKSAFEIISACKETQPDYLGMTVLQFDSEEDLCEISKNIPEKTKMIVGGPVFKSDPDIAKRVRVHYTAKDVTAFIQFFLSQ